MGGKREWREALAIASGLGVIVVFLDVLFDLVLGSVSDLDDEGSEG